MSGVVIFTRDAAPYRVGHYVESDGWQYPPTAPDTTYIIHDNKFSEKDAQGWVDNVPYRLIIVTNKDISLKGSDERVFGDKTIQQRKVSYRRNIEALFKWSDRLRVLRFIKTVPLPLVSSFLRVNVVDDIQSARRLAQARYTLPDKYTQAILAYSINPTKSKVVWPKKQTKAQQESLSCSRSTDKYMGILIENAPEIRNTIREQYPNEIPSTMRKTKEGVVEWV